MGEEDVAPSDVMELAKYCRSIETAGAARRFAELAMLLQVRGAPIGDPILPDPSLTGPGSGGRYGPRDAEAWNVPFSPVGTPHGGGWKTQMIVCVAPQEHSDLLYMTPWRVVQLNVVVYPDGVLSVLDDRTLTNGDDAARYARF
jgi:hypothetical protein